MIAEMLMNQFKMSWTIGAYIAVAAVISLVGVSLVKETKGVDLHVADAHEDYVREHPGAAH
jgi:hypothetical protein